MIADEELRDLSREVRSQINWLAKTLRKDRIPELLEVIHTEREIFLPELIQDLKDIEQPLAKLKEALK